MIVSYSGASALETTCLQFWFFGLCLGVLGMITRGQPHPWLHMLHVVSSQTSLHGPWKQSGTNDTDQWSGCHIPEMGFFIVLMLRVLGISLRCQHRRFMVWVQAMASWRVDTRIRKGTMHRMRTQGTLEWE